MRPTKALATAAVLFFVSICAPRDAHCSTLAGRTEAGALVLTIAAARIRNAGQGCVLAADPARDAGDDSAKGAAALPRRETTAEHRVYEAEQVSREVPESAIGKPIVTVGIASGSRLQIRVGPACKSMSAGGFAIAGRF